MRDFVLFTAASSVLNFVVRSRLDAQQKQFCRLRSLGLQGTLHPRPQS